MRLVIQVCREWSAKVQNESVDPNEPRSQGVSRARDQDCKGLNTFVEVGNDLLAIRDGRLYRKNMTPLKLTVGNGGK